MPLYTVLGDITKMKTDAIVNAANPQLRQGGGVCGAIFRAAGPEKMQAACNRYGSCPVGQAVITGGFQLPAKFVIHTVGPRYQPGNLYQDGQLRSCYRNSLALAEEFHVRSIAFPLISTGVYGYPKWEAVCAAVHTILQYDKGMDVYLCIMEPELHKMIQDAIGDWLDFCT